MKEQKTKPDVFNNLTMLPHAYILLINVIIVFMLANTEINARVASTCPYYFYALAQLIIEVFEDFK